MRIISGGQTGADLGGLIAGCALGLPTGGWAPRGWRTEAGPNPALGEVYGLVEHASSDYRLRTRANVRTADGTLIFGDLGSAGSRLTLFYCKDLGKPVFEVRWNLVDGVGRDRKGPTFVEWLAIHKIETLNVAGNRESVNPGICEAVRKFLTHALEKNDVPFRLY